MALEFIKVIGEQIKEANKFFDTFGVNAIQLPSGQVIKFTVEKEKQYIGIADCTGNTFYIRFAPQINYGTNDRKLRSCENNQSAVVNCKLVAFSFEERKKLDTEKVHDKLLHDLKKINWMDFKNTPQITIRKSNFNYLDNFSAETKQTVAAQEFMCISIDFDLKYLVNLASCDCTDNFYIPQC
jgi:hypothetical protein